MATLEWGTIPFTLTSPIGTLALNDEFSTIVPGMFILNDQKCSAAPVLRVEADDVPQGEGSILHNSYRSGYIVRLAIELWETREEPACAEVLRVMHDTFMAHVDALVRPDLYAVGTGLARLQWTPSGYGDDRMYDRIELLEWPVPEKDAVVVTLMLSFHTPLPYAIDLTQNDDELDLTVMNEGTTTYYPVFKVHGPCTEFVITNETTGEEIVYDSAFPGAPDIASGHYAEIATFTNTAYLDGNSSNLKPGINPFDTDFFGLIPGANDLTFVNDGSATCEILWNNAWA